MTTSTLIIGLFIHWMADFLFQSDKMAKGKSTNNSDLLTHTSIYSFIWFIFIGIFLNPFIVLCLGMPRVGMGELVSFCIITFIAHTITDYITSREVKKMFEKQDHHNGFVIIGFDQILHYLQLYFTAKYLNII